MEKEKEKYTKKQLGAMTVKEMVNIDLYSKVPTTKLSKVDLIKAMLKVQRVELKKEQEAVLVNYVSTSTVHIPPVAPYDGQAWLNTEDNQLYIYDASVGKYLLKSEWESRNVGTEPKKQVKAKVKEGKSETKAKLPKFHRNNQFKKSVMTLK